MRKSEVYSKFIKADALKDGDGYTSLVLTIDGKPRTHEFDDGTKQRCIGFLEDERELGLNVTNWDAIAAITGMDDDEQWAGTQIELYVDPKIKFGSRTVAGIRIRKPQGVSPPIAPPRSAPPPAKAAAGGPPPSRKKQLSATDKNSAWKYACEYLQQDSVPDKDWQGAIDAVGPDEDVFTPEQWNEVALKAAGIPM